MRLGHIEIEPISFDLQVLCEDVIELIDSFSREQGDFSLPAICSQLSQTLIGDAGRIRQILTNLISNGIKFTHHGHVLVVVKCEGTTEDKAAISY